MQFLVERLERFLTFVFLLIAATVFWPPNSYFIGTRTSAQAAAAGGTNIFDSVAFAALAGFLGIAILVHWRKIPAADELRLAGPPDGRLRLSQRRLV